MSHVLLALTLAFLTGHQTAGGPSTTEYVVGAQDILSITVYDEPMLSSKYTVDAEGMLTFPWLGRVPVSGKTLREVVEDLTQKLAAGYLRRPQVSVVMDTFRSQSVYVVGEVRTPGLVTLTGNMTLMDVLARVGGPNTNASDEVIIVRPKQPRDGGGPLKPGDKEVDTQKVSLEALTNGTASPVTIRDGDTISVGRAAKFYVSGFVRTPGTYTLVPGMTVLQALTLAGGISERGSHRGITIIRETSPKKKSIKVKLDDVVQPNDTILVRQRLF